MSSARWRSRTICERATPVRGSIRRSWRCARRSSRRSCTSERRRISNGRFEWLRNLRNGRRGCRVRGCLAWIGASFAAAAVVALAIFVLPMLSRPSRTERIAQDVVSAHIRSLMPGHLTDVPSSEHHTVKPWFAGKLDFSPPVADLSAEGFLLVGGRLDYAADRPVAALVYRKGEHVINLFVWPSASNARVRGGSRRPPGLQPSLLDSRPNRLLRNLGHERDRAEAVRRPGQGPHSLRCPADPRRVTPSAGRTPDRRAWPAARGRSRQEAPPPSAGARRPRM